MFPDLTRDDVFRLETRRLWLRWPRQADGEAVVRLAGDKAVADMTSSIPHPYPRAAAEPFLLEARRANAAGEKLMLAITPVRKPAALIGMIGAHPVDAGTVETGFWLGAEHWGQGYATEALRALVDAVFGYTDFTAIVSQARVINPASRRVHEKCGFSHRGSGLAEMTARGGLYPVDHFRLDRRAWASLKSWRQTSFAPPVREDGAPELCAAP